jgi:hypothetical protein
VQLIYHRSIFPPLGAFPAELSFVFYSQLVIRIHAALGGPLIELAWLKNWDIFLQAFAQYPKVCPICD